MFGEDLEEFEARRTEMETSVEGEVVERRGSKLAILPLDGQFEDKKKLPG